MGDKKENKELARAIILNAAARFMENMEKHMTTRDVLSTAKQWAEWVEGE